jgi:hypothetical protein
MKVGVTATRKGMSPAQKQVFRTLLIARKATELHHGDCVGGDDDAVTIARELGGIQIVCHPPTNEKLRAFTFREGDLLWPAQPYLERNRSIVKATVLLIASPLTDRPDLRSGTWYTIRYAHQIKHEVIIMPRGKE